MDEKTWLIIYVVIGWLTAIVIELQCNHWKRKHSEAITAWTIESNNKDKQILKLQEELENLKEKPVKRGHWKDIMMSEATGWDLSLTGGRDAVCETVCSVCGDCCAFGGNGDLYLSNYCPNCGARMDGNENDKTYRR